MKRVALLILLVLVFLAGNYVRKELKERGTLAAAAYRMSDGHVEHISPIRERLYYSHSVWAHGVGSAQELLDVMNADPELGQRYEACRDSIQFQQLAHDIDVFSTFRSTTRIAWSKKRIHVKAGEWIITCGNGALTLLARCLNQVAWVPMEPTDTVNTSTLETPEFPQPPIVIAPPVESASSLPPITTPPIPIESPTGGWCCIVGGGYPTKLLPTTPISPAPPVSPIPPSVPVAVPEPSVPQLLLSALLGCCGVKVMRIIFWSDSCESGSPQSR
jgi:hypothetical protein